MRSLGSRLLIVMVFGLLPICLGGLSGCDSKPADGSLVESAQIDEKQKAEVQAQYRKRILARQGKSSKKGRTARGLPAR